MSVQLDFKELVDVAELQKLTDDLYAATDIPSAIITLDGEILTKSGWQSICADFHRQHPDTNADCIASDTAIREEISKGETYAIYKCPRGLVDASSPVIIEGEHVASVFTGQIFTSPPSKDVEKKFRETARQYGFDEDDYINAFRNIPVLSEDRFKPILRFLSGFAKLVTNLGLARLEERMVSDEIHNTTHKYLRLLQSIRTVPWELDLDSGKFTYMGPQAEELFGYPISYWQDIEAWSQTIHPNDRGWAMTFCDEETRKGKDHDFTYRMLTKDGRFLWIHDVVTVIIGENGPTRLVGLMHDVTESKRIEKKLHHHQTLLEKSQELGHIGSWDIDFTNNILVWTDEIYRIFGAPHDSLISYDLFLEKVHPEDLEYVDREWRAAIQGKPYDIEHRIVVAGEIKWVREKADLTFDVNGKAVSAVGFTQDITNRINMEKQLRQTHKMEAIGTMAGGIAHDFNNLLAVITSNIDIIQYEQNTESPVAENVEHVIAAISRAKNLVTQILTFSRQEKHVLLPVDLALSVEDSLRLLRSTIPATVEIMTTVDRGSLFINAEATQLQQVLINLCANAVYAMDEKGQLRVNLEAVELAAKDLQAGTDGQAGRYAKLSVSDSGSGMEKELIDRIFDPFFTTKDVGVGSGMGLSMVHGIVTQHGGFITVDSTLGRGATFNLYFPAVEQGGEPIAEAVEPLPVGTERVLFVDDGECIAEACGKLLGYHGYQVTSATSSTEALAVFQSNPQDFDLVFTDQAMPKMSGMELATELLKLRPDLPIILCSGYSAKVTEQEAKGLGIREFCTKPMDMKQLVTVTRKVLDGK